MKFNTVQLRNPRDTYLLELQKAYQKHHALKKIRSVTKHSFWKQVEEEDEKKLSRLIQFDYPDKL